MRCIVLYGIDFANIAGFIYRFNTVLHVFDGLAVFCMDNIYSVRCSVIFYDAFPFFDSGYFVNIAVYGKMIVRIR